MNDQKFHFNEIVGINYPHLNYEEYGVMGVGKNRLPIVPMDKYIDHSMNDELHAECCKGLAMCDDIKMGMVFGALPPEEVERLHGSDCYSQIFADLPSDSPHMKVLEELVEICPPEKRQAALYKYAYFAMGAAIPWFFALYLKHNNFGTKTEDKGIWTPSSNYFPKVKAYLDTLPFKVIGRVLFFTTYPNAGVVIHRDAGVVEHSDHNINLFFSPGWRPSFVWDEIKKEKIYLEQGARSYFFNNRDYHGVDAEPTFRYTLRVDGTFTDELCEELGLEDGKTWKWSYK